MICSTLNDSVVTASPSASLVADDSPRKFAGTRPLRKSSQLPVEEGSAAFAGSTPVRSPGSRRRPSAIPMSTAIRAVAANQRRVWTTSLAALARSLRAAIEATIAAKTRGGTSVRSSWMKIAPTVCSPSASALPSPRPRAQKPSATPSARPRKTWIPNEGSGKAGSLLMRSVRVAAVTGRCSSEIPEHAIGCLRSMAGTPREGAKDRSSYRISIRRSTNPSIWSSCALAVGRAEQADIIKSREIRRSAIFLCV